MNALGLKGAAGDSGLGVIADAESDAAMRLGQVFEGMVGKPLTPDTLLGEQAALKARANAMLARQHAALEQSERYGRRSSAAARGLLLVAMAGALLALAGSLAGRRPALVAVGTGGLVLCAAVATGVLGLVT